MREIKHYQAQSGENLKTRKHKRAQLGPRKLTQEIRVTVTVAYITMLHKNKLGNAVKT